MAAITSSCCPLDLFTHMLSYFRAFNYSHTY